MVTATTSADRPRIYAASLADYNAGTLYGRWINADQEPEDIKAEIAAMLALSPEHSEEFGIFDYDNFHGIHLGEYESVDRVAAIANAITEYGPAFAAWIEDDPENDFGSFAACYCGEWDSGPEYAAEHFDRLTPTDAIATAAATIGVPSYWLTVDYEDIWLDLTCSDGYTAVPSGRGTVYVFRPDY